MYRAPVSAVAITAGHQRRVAFPARRWRCNDSRIYLSTAESNLRRRFLRFKNRSREIYTRPRDREGYCSWILPFGRFRNREYLSFILRTTTGGTILSNAWNTLFPHFLRKIAVDRKKCQRRSDRAERFVFLQRWIGVNARDYHRRSGSETRTGERVGRCVPSPPRGGKKKGTARYSKGRKSRKDNRSSKAAVKTSPRIHGESNSHSRRAGKASGGGSRINEEGFVKKFEPCPLLHHDNMWPQTNEWQR